MIKELHASVRAGRVHRIRRIAAHLPHLIEALCPNGWTALIVASYHGQATSIRTILELGADPNRTNPKGTTPLMYAKGYYLRSGDAEPMRILLKAGADRYALDGAGLALLDYVPAGRRTEIEAIFALVDCDG